MSELEKNIDPAVAQYVQDSIAAALAGVLPDIQHDIKLVKEGLGQAVSQIRRDTVTAATAPNLDEVVAGFKAQLDANLASIRADLEAFVASTEKRCDETDDLVSRFLAQLADLEVRLRKYMEGDRYTITKRQVARLMRESNG